ncbi:MAG: hypothetical protein ABIQ01_06015 [Pseudolysinimonas sp.]
MNRILSLGSMAVAAAIILGGCSLLPSVPTIDPPQTESPTAAPTGPPAGFEELAHCDGAPETPWVWVDGFPAAEFEASGATADCGDTWPQDDGETFVNITAYAMTVEQLDAFGAALEASGYEKLFDDFTPGTPSGESYYGARDYYLDGVSDGAFTRLAIEIYPTDASETTWTAYIDYLSPETRAL